MNKHIRVLAGAHAGACLDLTPGHWMVGSGPEASIRIADWTADALSLRVDTEKGILIESDDGDLAWEDLSPRRFGDVILCVGPVGETWPSDLALLQRVLSSLPAITSHHGAAPAESPTADARAAARPRARKGWMGVAAVALLTPCALLLASTRETPQAARAQEPALPPLIERIRACLAQHHIDGLQIEQRDTNITVHGIVGSAAEELATLRDLRTVSPETHTDLSIAPEIVENLRESLQEPGLRIAYLGDNRFSIAGAASHPERVRATAEHVRSDLGSNIKDIVLDVTQARARDAKTDATSALSVDELRYVESSDGTKDFLAAQH
ncbi:type III secretion protein HrpW [Ralstonia sp. A12]|uniref:HrpD5 family protein n=1 Tax=Ralstonia sp. A12 TaxID=1217052 RepID=UPI000574076A|nr:HrpD5 family protein [Ralstonia sp. A12]KHK49842.1 type III secretion protein HrpW [Ralstonia sp. A12]